MILCYDLLTLFNLKLVIVLDKVAYETFHHSSENLVKNSYPAIYYQSSSQRFPYITVLFLPFFQFIEMLFFYKISDFHIVIEIVFRAIQKDLFFFMVFEFRKRIQFEQENIKQH